MNRKAALALIFMIGFSVRVSAQTPQLQREDGDDEKVPVDLFTLESNYVFESDLNHGGKVGELDSSQASFEYGHRFLIQDKWYFHLGFAYDRFDFGNTTAPVPVHLQSGAAVIGIEYMKGSDIGALIEFRPGIYTEEHVGLASFDCPITIARFFVLREDQLYLLVGVNGAFLRGTWPVIPVAGLVWIPNDTWRLMGIPPEPRVIYSPTKDLSFWLGGEISGGSFRTDHDNTITPAKLNGAAVDYVDYRAGGGVIYSLNDAVDVDLGVGYSIQRAFRFERADLFYRADPAPYVRFQVKAKF